MGEVRLEHVSGAMCLRCLSLAVERLHQLPDAELSVLNAVAGKWAAHEPMTAGERGEAELILARYQA